MWLREAKGGQTLKDPALRFLPLRAAHVTDLLLFQVVQPRKGHIIEEMIMNGLMMVES